MADNEFLAAPPADAGQVYVLSPEPFRKCRFTTYVAAATAGGRLVLEIRHNATGNYSKGLAYFERFIAIGHHTYFYLFDLEAKKETLAISLDFPFVSMYEDAGSLYVTSTQGIYCVSRDGVVIWRNTSLGIDGVFIDRFDGDVVHGTGGWDPPDGWRRFTVKKLTGLEVDEPF